jgi:single-strand DNA-binding protein
MQMFMAVGNLANDPELRKTNSGISVCTFRLAVQRDFKNAQGVREADFFNIVAWRGLADLCARSLSKGKKISIVGKLQNRSYDAQDGSKRFVTEVIMEELEFLSPRGETAQKVAESVSDAMPSNADGFQEVLDDQLPFEQSR